jgi:hypothetical protein
MHDWTRVEAGIYHAFHHEWISEISRALNRGLLPEEYYALPEQQAAGFGPDVLTLQSGEADRGGGAATQTRPVTTFRAETPAAFYRRKKSTVVIRHVSGDIIVAMVDLVSPGNNNNARAFRDFVDTACELLENRIHLLLFDPFPPGKRDPNGIHAAIWENVEEEPFQLPPTKPLTLVAYEAGPPTRAYIEPIAVGDRFPDMPLFLDFGKHILTPLESTYMAAWDALPMRWRRVVDPTLAG